MTLHSLIHDWNRADATTPREVLLDDETLRDGLQSPSVQCPTVRTTVGDSRLALH